MIKRFGALAIAFIAIVSVSKSLEAGDYDSGGGDVGWGDSKKAVAKHYRHKKSEMVQSKKHRGLGTLLNESEEKMAALKVVIDMQSNKLSKFSGYLKSKSHFKSK